MQSSAEKSYDLCFSPQTLHLLGLQRSGQEVKVAPAATGAFREALQICTISACFVLCTENRCAPAKQGAAFQQGAFKIKAACKLMDPRNTRETLLTDFLFSCNSLTMMQLRK